jgi:hypothetical protein
MVLRKEIEQPFLKTGPTFTSERAIHNIREGGKEAFLKFHNRRKLLKNLPQAIVKKNSSF